MNDENIYRSSLRTSYQFCDDENRLIPPYIWRIMNGTASLQLYDKYDSLERLKESGKAYVILRADVNYIKPVPPYKNITVSTWIRNNSLLKIIRNYSVEDEEGVYAEASSVWAYIDLETRKPLRISEVEKPAEPCARDVRADASKKVCMPETVHSFYRTVIRTDIDLYGHMNNAKYFDIVCDALPYGLIKRFKIDYLNECKLGDILDIRTLIDGKTVFVSGVKGNGAVSFNCEVLMQ